MRLKATLKSCRAKFHVTQIWYKDVWVYSYCWVWMLWSFFDLGCFGLGVFFVLFWGFVFSKTLVCSKTSLHLFVPGLNGVGSCTEFNVSISILIFFKCSFFLVSVIWCDGNERVLKKCIYCWSACENWPLIGKGVCVAAVI